MKRISIALLTAVLAINFVNAQEKNYNRWAIDLNGGIAKPARTLSPGYSAETFENLHLDGGVRYSLNNKFGIKGSFGYDQIDKWSNNADLRSEYYRTSLEGVVNLGRVLNFENWTKAINVQAHAGGGYSWLRGQGFEGTDNMGHLMAGLTGQVKLFPRVALNADFTVIQNVEQNKNWDGLTATNRSVFQGTMMNATVGISIYLGKQGQHADWYSEESQTANKLTEIENRLDTIEGMLIDTDNDGVADYLDQEPNTPAGAVVDTKGRSITDSNNNGIADNIENYFEMKYGKDDKETKLDDNAIKDLINNGFVAVYFDFNKSQPSSVDGINFIKTYMERNPEASLEVIGYADSVGNQGYNDKLSQKRADSVKNILVKSGVNTSRISSKGNGVDTSADKDSSLARKVARKVIFVVK